MSDANTGNILNRPFGLNITLPQRTLQQFQETATNAVNLFSPVVDYLEENDKVFSGEVARQIEKYNEMAYAMGSAARAGKDKTTFNMKG